MNPTAECYLIVRGTPARWNPRESVDLKVTRISQRKPSLAANEIALKVTVELPASLFLKPTLEARVAVPDGAPMATVITPEVADNIAAVCREQLGIRLRVEPGEVSE